MSKQRFKVILLSALCLTLITIVLESPKPFPIKAHPIQILIYTAGFSFGYLIFALPIQLILYKKFSLKRFGFRSMSVYIIGSFLTFFFISLLDLEYNGFLPNQLLGYVYYFGSGLLFWLWDAILIPGKQESIA